MPHRPCSLCDVTIRWRDPAVNDWQDFDVLSLSWQTLGEVCDLFELASIEVVGKAEGVRVVNSARLVSELYQRKLPARTFTQIRAAALAAGVLDQPFHAVGFGPGLYQVRS